MRNSIIGTLVITMFILIGCQTDDINPVTDLSSEVSVRGGKPNDKGNGKGKGGKNDDDGTGEEPPAIEYGDTYQLYERDEFDPLYRFVFSVDGSLVLFETDSTITTWGTDYWGFWSEPYEYNNGVVHYFSGLSSVTYEFDLLAHGLFDVTRTLISSDYFGNITVNEVKHCGTYLLVE